MDTIGIYFAKENYKITDPRISGWVDQRKLLEKRLINYFKNNNPIEEKIETQPQPTRLTKEEFSALNREEQEKLLKDLEIDYSNKDKEKDLLKKYLKA